MATVVLLTGEDDPGAAREAFALGVYSYLVEPFWPGQLLITVMSALRRRELEIKVAAHVQDVEDRRQAIIDMAPIPIYAKDLSGRYTVANAKADELAGLRRGELLGLTDEAFLSADELDAVGGISIDISAEAEALDLRDQLSLNQERAIEELRLSNRETIAGLSNALDLHDPSTGKHSERVAEVAALLGARLGLDDNRVELLRAAAPMHDVGKIGTPAEFSASPGRWPWKSAPRSAPYRRRPPDLLGLPERSLAPGGDDRPHPSRAFRRQRLSAGPRRRGDPPGGPDRDGCGCLLRCRSPIAVIDRRCRSGRPSLS